MAEDIAFGNFFTNSGNLNAAATALIHEWIHVVIYNNDLQDDFESEEQEEHFVHSVAIGLYGNIVPLLQLLDNEQFTDTELRMILNYLRNIKAHYHFIKNDPQFESVHELICQILDLLGLEDENGNNIPDFIDDLMEEFIEDWQEACPPLPDWFWRGLKPYYPVLINEATIVVEQKKADPACTGG